MSGKEIESIKTLFGMQKEFQKKVTGIDAPVDDTRWFSYHITAMVEELGEILKADKRWKTHRNIRYVPDEKLTEIADAYITLMNITMFSGFSAEELYNAVFMKITENMAKLDTGGLRK